MVNELVAVVAAVRAASSVQVRRHANLAHRASIRKPAALPAGFRKTPLKAEPATGSTTTTAAELDLESSEDLSRS